MNDQILINVEMQDAAIMPVSPEECTDMYGKNLTSEEDEAYCPAAWDSMLCWPPVQAGHTAWISCIRVLSYINHPDLADLELPEGIKAFRVCDTDSQWLWGNWTNYSECLSFINLPEEIPKAPLTVSLILLVCSLISLFFLGLTIFIFFYFKSLQCSRLRVHRNLVLAMIVHSLTLVILSYPVVGGPDLPSYKDISWLCKALLSVKMYAALSSINWMFVEGMQLHSRITTNIFQQDAPFKLYYLIGWGIPLILIASWCFCMNFHLDRECWGGYGKSPYVWIITGPMMAALVVNLIFLLNIIRILVTKMRTSSTSEMVQVKRAIKATALLFPLLGIPHLLFCVNPMDDSKLEEAYMITNAVLQSSQGIFVSILYCFMNVEVRTVLRKAYLRAALRRNPNHRYTWKCRTTRTSQTSTYLSNCENNSISNDGRSLHILRQHGGHPRKFATKRSDLNGMTISDV